MIPAKKKISKVQKKGMGDFRLKNCVTSDFQSDIMGFI